MSSWPSGNNWMCGKWHCWFQFGAMEDTWISWAPNYSEANWHIQLCSDWENNVSNLLVGLHSDYMLCGAQLISSPLIYVVLFCGLPWNIGFPWWKGSPWGISYIHSKPIAGFALWLGHHFLQKTIQSYTHHGPDLHIMLNTLVRFQGTSYNIYQYIGDLTHLTMLTSPWWSRFTTTG
jgi:hypothetical protein